MPSDLSHTPPHASAGEDAELKRMRLALETTLGVPFVGGNTITAYQNGNEIFPAMIDAVRAAEKRIEFLTFVYWTGDIAERFVQALAERAKAGVEVLVMLDGIGARPMPKQLVDRLEEAGAIVRWFRPLPNWKLWQIDSRTHRKILVCDGTVGFTGGVGIASEWEGDADRPDNWRDTHFRIRGPAVLGLRGAFFEDWNESALSVEPAVRMLVEPGRPGDVEMQVIAATASVGRSDISVLNDTLILMAQKRLRLCTAYFSPAPDTRQRLIEAHERGVQIQVMIPGPHADRRISELAGSNDIGELLEAGVEIEKFQPTMLHQKLITVDGVLTVVGSANFNHRSITKDDEIAVNVLDRDFCAEMDAMFDKDRERCAPVDLDEWEQRGLLRRIKERLASIVTRQT